MISLAYFRILLDVIIETIPSSAAETTTGESHASASEIAGTMNSGQLLMLIAVCVCIIIGTGVIIYFVSRKKKNGTKK